MSEWVSEWMDLVHKTPAQNDLHVPTFTDNYPLLQTYCTRTNGEQTYCITQMKSLSSRVNIFRGSKRVKVNSSLCSLLIIIIILIITPSERTQSANSDKDKDKCVYINNDLTHYREARHIKRSFNLEARKTISHTTDFTINPNTQKRQNNLVGCWGH